MSDNKSNEELINMIRRQTNWDADIISQKLEEYNNDAMKVIMDYHNIDLEKKKKEEESKLTGNQKIFKGIRDFFEH